MLIRRSAKMLAENVDCAWREPGRASKKNLALRKTALESTLPPHNDGAGHRVSDTDRRWTGLLSQKTASSFSEAV
jgi:hypothetical protein